MNLLSDDDKGGGGGGSSTPVASAASSVSQAAAVLAWLAPMPPRVLDRIRKWMRGAEGDWFVNLFFWWLGQFVFGIIQWIGNFLAIFTEWQWGYDTISDLVIEFAPPALTDQYQSNLKLGL